MTTRFPAPKQFRFSETYHTQYRDTWWRCPVRLVRDGYWAELWRDADTTRGGGTASAVLPVLAVHTFPGKRAEIARPSRARLRALAGVVERPSLRLEPAGAPSPLLEPAAAGWTPWETLSHRRIAGLAGVNPSTVRKVLDYLGSLELCEDRIARVSTSDGRAERQQYRLRETLYARLDTTGPGDDGPYAEIHAMLFYGGMWSMLPTHAARHLFVVLACLDPVLNEEQYANMQRDDEGDESTDEFLARVRARTTYTLSDLSDYSGLPRQTLREAVRILTTPIFRAHDGAPLPTIPLVRTGTKKGATSDSAPRWYAPRRGVVRGRERIWLPEFLNGPRSRVERTREELWTELKERRQAARQAQAQRERAAKARKAAAKRKGERG